MMDEVLRVVQNITVFILLFSIVSNLFSRSKYIRYFKFVEGLIVIILVMAPLFSWFTSDTFFDEILEKNIFKMEQKFDEDELKMIGEQRDKLLEKEWMKGGETKYEER